MDQLDKERLDDLLEKYGMRHVVETLRAICLERSDQATDDRNQEIWATNARALNRGLQSKWKIPWQRAGGAEH